MPIPEHYTPTPGDLLTLGEKSLEVHWVTDDEVGYAINFGGGEFDAFHRRKIDDFVARCREQGLSLVAPNVEPVTPDGP